MEPIVNEMASATVSHRDADSITLSREQHVVECARFDSRLLTQRKAQWCCLQAASLTALTVIGFDETSSQYPTDTRHLLASMRLWPGDQSEVPLRCMLIDQSMLRDSCRTARAWRGLTMTSDRESSPFSHMTLVGAQQQNIET